jgi:hypothetical protein
LTISNDSCRETTRPRQIGKLSAIFAASIVFIELTCLTIFKFQVEIPPIAFRSEHAKLKARQMPPS